MRTVKTAVTALRRYACFIVAASTLTLSVEVVASPASAAVGSNAKTRRVAKNLFSIINTNNIMTLIVFKESPFFL